MCATLLLGIWAVTGYGQDGVSYTRMDLDETQSAEDYRAAVRFSRVQNDMYYIDRLDGEIPMDGAPRYTPPEPETDSDVDPEAVNWGFTAVFALVLVLAALLLWKFGGGASSRFANREADVGPREAKPRKAAKPSANDEPETARLIDRLLAMADKEAALVELVQHVLHASAKTHGMRHSRSETARELVRRLPASWQRLGDLRRIVLAEELVQFGGRALADETFEDCIARARPILNGLVR